MIKWKFQAKIKCQIHLIQTLSTFKALTPLPSPPLKAHRTRTATLNRICLKTSLFWTSVSGTRDRHLSLISLSLKHILAVCEVVVVPPWLYNKIELFFTPKNTPSKSKNYILVRHLEGYACPALTRFKKVPDLL